VAAKGKDEPLGSSPKRGKGDQNISNFFLFRQIISVWPLVKSNLRFYSEKLNKGLKKNKRSLRDPLLYLGVLSSILFLTLIFGAGSILNPPFQEGGTSFFSAAASEVFNKFSNQDLFISKKGKTETPDLNMVQENSLAGISSPTTLSFQVLGSLTDGGSKEITEYLVQQGDTFSVLSQKFGISTDTIVWANNLSKNAILQTGQKLIIPPVSGTIHHVKKGDTLGEIAKTYKSNAEDIISFNELSERGDIYIGDILVIPNGIMPSLPTPSYPQTPLASSYFICPILSPCRITQGLHWYNAIDFSNGSCGDPIFAAAGGAILKVKYGWNSGAGNTVTILHPNGVVTTYGHLQTILVVPEQIVSQGQMIALMGGQPGTLGAGRSTGCHLHFGVQGSRNPFSR